MCQPSASKAMEPSHHPPVISAAIMTTVSHIAMRVCLSPVGLPVSKWWWVLQGEHREMDDMAGRA